MQARYGRLTIQENIKKTTVPDDDVARLMYYLKCVFTVLKYNGFSQYTDYKNYEKIDSFEGFSKVMELATIFNPSVMIKAGIFVINENIGESNNRFFEITDKRLNFQACKEIVIGGIRTRVIKIMFMKSI